MKLKISACFFLLFFYFQSVFSQKYNFEVISDLFGYNSPTYWRSKGNIVITDSSISIITKVKGKIKDEEKFIITGLEGANNYNIKNVNENSARATGLAVLTFNKGRILGLNYNHTINFSFDGINNSFTYYCIKELK